MRRILIAMALAATACDGRDPLLPPTVDSSVAFPDLGFLDSGLADSAVADADAGVSDRDIPDGEPTDSSNPGDGGRDVGPSDNGMPADQGPSDATGSDATPVDSGDSGPRDGSPGDTGLDGGSPTDGGQGLRDSDNDGISDFDEGDGAVDTDGDGVPDSLDSDSDGDGIPDAIEAGDSNLRTPPRDTDGDGTADFRDLDSDGDGLSDEIEGSGDPDGDGRPNFRDDDSDGDLIRDAEEGNADVDGDTQPNFLDLDSDGDGISDRIEGGDGSIVSPAIDSDFDGTADYLDLDSDNDTISDQHEGNLDFDGDGVVNRIDIDSDNDAVLDMFEAGDTDLNTPPVDSDADGSPDFLDYDSDGDSISDAFEGRVDTDGDMVEDRLDLDSDGDGFGDSIEAGDSNILTVPIDSDGDGRPDFRDLDSDDDGLIDSVEPGCPAGSDRRRPDSDFDGFDDLAEAVFGSNPCDGSQGITDFYFVLPPGGPLQNAPLTFADTNIDRADFVLNVDTTGSMGQEIANIQTALSTTIIPGIDAVVPDAAFGVSHFQDVPFDLFGASTDVPFQLLSRVTTDAAVAQTAVNALALGNGFDFAESGIESIYQVASGVGMSYAGGGVPAFDPTVGLVPGVADGTIGGAGFRQDSLPVILHVTDAISHTDVDYNQSASAIGAAGVTDMLTSVDAIGGRVVSVSSGLQPFNDMLCSGASSSFYGAIETLGVDADWFALSGVQMGDVVSVLARAQTLAGSLNVAVAVFNRNGIIGTIDDSGGALYTDAQLSVFITGPGPYYVAVTASGDLNFDGIGGGSTGFYVLDVQVNANSVAPSPSVCRLDDGGDRATATPLSFAPVAAADLDACVAQCDSILGSTSPRFQDMTFPIELPGATRAVVPPCAWDQFGPARPASCASNQCCTGQNGAGVASDQNGNCPLAFQMDSAGTGLDQALVTGVEALVNFSTFTITSVVRPDPVELAASGIDSSCFIHGVVPSNATPPNSCAFTPTAVDLQAPSPELDSWQGVTPGTILEFLVNAQNRNRVSSQPCVASTRQTQQFLAYIDLVADGVTVVDTRRVIIIVPPRPPTSEN